MTNRRGKKLLATGYVVRGKILLLACWQWLVAGGMIYAEEAVNIGLHKQLFVDDYIVAEKQNVSRELGKSIKANKAKPILVRDQPWEDGLGLISGSVLSDGNKFRMWYNPWPGATAYAESEDGIIWEKPALGIYDFNEDQAKKSGFSYKGSGKTNGFKGKANNIINDQNTGLIIHSLFLDRQETDPAHRFKGVFVKDVKACLAHSADGFTWKAYNNGNHVTGRAADTTNQLIWDEDKKTYRLYTRTDFGAEGGSGEIRGNRGMINPDVKNKPTNWTTIRNWKFDEPKRRQVYALTDTIYEGVHFASVYVYEFADDLREGPLDLFRRHERCILNYYIATSRDGDHWDLQWVYAGKPIVLRGPDGSFDKDRVKPFPGFVTCKDKHWLYYSGYRERHFMFPLEPAIGLATLRLDGFVCLESREQPGTVITKPFKLEGKELEVNVDAQHGKIQVEILDENGERLSGFAAADAETYKNVDHLRLIPRWRNNLNKVKGRNIRLQFNLENAKLYAFEIKE